MDKFFERICVITIVIILATITWAMWKPVSQNQQIIRAIQNQNSVLQRHEQDINLLKKNINEQKQETK